MRLAAILVAALAISACAHGSSGPEGPERPASSEDVVAAVKGTLEQWRQAWEVRGEDALRKLYAVDPLTIVVDNGREAVSYAAVETMIKERLARSPKIVIRVRDTAITPLGPNAATLTASVTRELGDDVTTVTEKGVLTLVMRRAGDAWVIVTEHYSLLKGT